MAELDQYDVLEHLLTEMPAACLDPAGLSKAIRACNGKPIPPLLLEYLCATIEGRIKKRKGPKRKNTDLQYVLRFLAPLQYKQYLEWLQKRKKTQGLQGWSCIRNAEWWQEGDSPHVRAAKMLKKRFFPDADYRHVLNIVNQPLHLDELYLI